MHRFLRQSCLALLVLTGAALVPRYCCAAANRAIEGDRALIDLLAAAQETGKVAFPRGALDATVHSYVPTQEIDVTAHLIWDGQSTYWNYVQTVKNKGVEPEVSSAEMIETPGGRIVYWPKLKLAQRIGQHQSSYRPELQLRPEQVWFNSFVGLSRWSELLDIGNSNRPPKVHFDKLAVRQEQDLIVVERYYTSGKIYRIKASLKMGANIVEYETIPTADDPNHGRGRFDWVELPDKRWRLKHREYAYWFRVDEKQPDKTFTLDVTSFDPDPVIPASRFDEGSLNIAPGTVVETLGGSGTDRRRVGQEVPSQKRLDELAKELRQQGFALPSKGGR